MPKTSQREIRRRKSFKTHKKTASPKRKSDAKKIFNPRINQSLKKVFKQIGQPEASPFRADQYQMEALANIKQGDVIVSAPTGAGKTYIAVEAMADVLATGGRAWYASPLKALSNSKFSEFGQRFGPENVGLLTGDHKINPDAPLTVGTTEILRNQLYDAMQSGQTLPTELVVLDEAHYIGDPDRGVVWEEVIIYLPPRIRLLLLSATVSNASEIASWLRHVRKSTVFTVISRERPVPLYPLFLFPDGELTPLTQGNNLFPKIKNISGSKGSRWGFGGQVQFPAGRTLRVMDKANLLPAVFFLKSRADCDLALSRCFNAAPSYMADKKGVIETRLRELLENYPFLKNHHHIKYVVNAGVASHHAGHLPHWKLVIETLMQEGLLAAIFSTSTVAAGVNFPARTVVVPQSDRFNGQGFVGLSATDLQQMTGRAGRRGKDLIGFALFIPGPFQDIELIHGNFQSEPDPIKSKIQINFSMVLNLLLSHQPKQIKHLLELSLAAFQETDPSPETRAMDADIKNRLANLTETGLCKNPEKALELFQSLAALRKEEQRLIKAIPRKSRESFLNAALTGGRIFSRLDGRTFTVVNTWERYGRKGVNAARIGNSGLTKNNELRTRRIPFERVGAVYSTILDINAETDPNEAVEKIKRAVGMEHEPLSEADLTKNGAKFSDKGEKQQLKRIKAQIKELKCFICPEAKKCLGAKKSRGYKLLAELDRFDRQNQMQSQALWNSFLKHLEFLRQESFISENDELNEDGRGAAKLRLDHPLVIAEAIRAGAWPNADPYLLAALVAPFVVDKDRESMKEKPSAKWGGSLKSGWLALEKAVQPIILKLKQAGFDTPDMYPRPAVAIYIWAKGEKWEDAVHMYSLDEGDMAMLIYRTADNLRQIAGLGKNHPALAKLAMQARDLILREPVIVPL